MKNLNTQFIEAKEVTAGHYDDMLGALPPARMAGNAFLVGEASDYDKDLSGKYVPRYELYFIKNRLVAGLIEEVYYFGGLASVQDFDAFVIK